MSVPSRTLCLASLWGAAVCVLVSCSGGAGSGGGAESSAVRQPRSLEDYQYNKETDVVYGKAGTETEGMIVGGRRSQFEGQNQVVFGGEFAGKTYRTEGYNTKSWAGQKGYGRKSYGGNTDASRLKVASAMDGRSAAAAGRQSSYADQTMPTSSYVTGSARESRAGGVTRASSYFADDRYPMPKIMSYRDYQKLTIQETNSLLGKD